MSVSTAAAQDAGVRCDVARPAAALPDPAACQSAVELRVPADADADQRAQRLVAVAKTRLQAGDQDGAGEALDCAESVLAGRGNATSRHALVRARGSLAYSHGRMPEAKALLECALSLAEAREARDAIASDTNAIGSTLRRLGDYRGALQAFTRSLEMQRAQGKVGGAVFNNIADVYREQGNHEEALRNYREARRFFIEAGKRKDAVHALESMAVVEMAKDRPREAARWLDEALGIYRELGLRDYELRTTGRLIEAALAQGDIAAAARWKATGLAVAAAHPDPLPAVFQWQVARLDRVSGDPSAAAARLRIALADTGDYESVYIELLQELALAQEALGDRAAALETLRRAHAKALKAAGAKHDNQLRWLLTIFQTAERDRTIARLEADNQRRQAEVRQRTLLLWLTVAVAVATMLGGWLVLQRRRQRERLLEAARLARKEEALARYRREAGALAEDRQLLQALLDSREDAVCLLDAEGLVLAANRAACTALGAEPRGLVGVPLSERLSAGDGDALRAALERMEDTTDQQLDLALADDRCWRARLSQWPQGDGLIVCELSVPPVAETADTTIGLPSGTSSARTPDAPVEQGEALAGAGPSEGAATQDTRLREDFRRSLVELMLSSLEAWERSTGSGRLELAEKSRIWRVAVDDGRVRARAMERYLGLSRLPQNPRWRDVVRTGYYVLEHCAMDADVRERLQRQVDTVLAYTRRSALV
ncbi:MAG: tetratricopeptide repeat protein [Lysobacter sp.]|nr:tetratricopeptide repeat protein [Lysobacter sp.]